MNILIVLILLIPTIANATPRKCTVQIINRITGVVYAHEIPFEEFDNEQAAHMFAQSIGISEEWVYKNTDTSNKVTWHVYLQEPPNGQCIEIVSD